jgi:hypothetical protein
VRPYTSSLPAHSLYPLPLFLSSQSRLAPAAFFFTPEDGLSLCLQCDLVVHPTSGPGWDRFMIYEQRVRLPKNVVDGGGLSLAYNRPLTL